MDTIVANRLATELQTLGQWRARGDDDRRLPGRIAHHRQRVDVAQLALERPKRLDDR
jgi:hypothetical protein